MAEINKEIELYKKEGANLLMPSTHYIDGLSKFHAVVVDAVRLDPDPENGDVYDPKDDGKFLRDKKDGTLNPLKKVRITKQGLNKLTNTAGLIWSPSQSHPITDRSDKTYVAYRAVGGIRRPDGQPLFYAATYDMDLKLEKEKLLDKYEGQADNVIPNTNPPKLWRGEKSHAEYVEYCVKRDMFQKRTNALKLCESGAKNRVIREVLGLKNAYTIAELQKPFVMARIIFQPDYTDKEVSRRLLDAHLAALTGIYGLPEPTTPGFSSKEIQETEPIDIVPADEDRDAYETAHEETAGDPNLIDAQTVDFGNYTPADQHLIITKLAFQKAYDLAGYQEKAKKNLGAMKPETLAALFKYLINLPDPVDEDCPF